MRVCLGGGERAKKLLVERRICRNSCYVVLAYKLTAYMA